MIWKHLAITYFTVPSIQTKNLLFGDSSLSDSSNIILNSTINYVIATKRFDDPIVT